MFCVQFGLRHCNAFRHKQRRFNRKFSLIHFNKSSLPLFESLIIFLTFGTCEQVKCVRSRHWFGAYSVIPKKYCLCLSGIMCTLPSRFVDAFDSNTQYSSRQTVWKLQIAPRQVSISLRFPQCIYLNLWLLLILKFRGFVRRSILFASWFGSRTVIPRKYCLCLSGTICTMPSRFADAFDLQHAVVEGTLEVWQIHDCSAQVVIILSLITLIGSIFSGFLSRSCVRYSEFCLAHVALFPKSTVCVYRE